MFLWLRSLAQRSKEKASASPPIAVSPMWPLLGAAGIASERKADSSDSVQFASRLHKEVSAAWPELAERAEWGWPGVGDDPVLMSRAAEVLARHTSGEESRQYRRLAASFRGADRRRRLREVRYRLDWPEAPNRVRFAAKFVDRREQWPGIHVYVRGGVPDVLLDVAFWSTRLGGGRWLTEQDVHFLGPAIDLSKAGPLSAVLEGLHADELGLISWWEWAEHGHGGPSYPSPRSQLVNLNEEGLVAEALDLAIEREQAQRSPGEIILSSWSGARDRRFL